MRGYILSKIRDAANMLKKIIFPILIINMADIKFLAHCSSPENLEKTSYLLLQAIYFYVNFVFVLNFVNLNQYFSGIICLIFLRMEPLVK